MQLSFFIDIIKPRVSSFVINQATFFYSLISIINNKNISILYYIDSEKLDLNRINSNN